MKRYLILMIAAAWTSSLFAATQAVPWRAGVARVDVTPEQPTWMAGYAARTRVAEGVLHPLWAKALVLEDHNGQRVAIVAIDVIGTTREMGDALAARVNPSTGLTRDRILLNASHTHCGPVIRGCAPIAYMLDAHNNGIIEQYTDQLTDRLAGLIEDACRALQPATLGYGEGQATFAMNRRAFRDGHYLMIPNPEGPVDHVVPVLRVVDQQDRTLAILFGYACHTTTLGSDVYQYNGDYAGFAQLAIEAAEPGAMALFLIGCGADSNPEPRGSIEIAQRHGHTLAEAVAETLQQPLQPVTGPLTVGWERVDLPFVEPPGRDVLESRREAGDVYQQRLISELLRQLDEYGSVIGSYPCPIQVIGLGDALALVALPGEPVADYALRLRRESPDKRLWIAGFCNEVFAYIPSERVLAEGGYEGADAMVYFGWHGPFLPGVEDRIISRVRQLLDGGNSRTR